LAAWLNGNKVSRTRFWGSKKKKDLEMRFVATAIAVLALVGCAGKVDYIRPSAQAIPGQNTKLISKSRDAVWAAAVPELGKRFFVINNLDKSSGLINVSYSGDPERFIDCGRITSFVKNARGERTYNFPGASAQQTYEVMNNRGLFFIDRRMDLEGRVNLIFEEVGPNETRVTASTRYIVKRSATVRDVQGHSANVDHSITFNSGGAAQFPGGADGATECAATGALEREILSVIK
jgi:hypothetical protein